MRTYIESECVHCKKVKTIAAKGLCRACYQRQQKTGSLEYKRTGIRNKCTVDGCDSNVISHGLCDKHRTNMKRNGSPTSTRPKDWGQREKHPLYHYWSDTKRRETLNIVELWKNDFWAFASCVKDRPSSKHYLRAVDMNDYLGPDNWQWVEGLTEANRKILNRQKRKNHDRNRLNLSADERASILSNATNGCQICGAEYNINDCPVTGDQLPKRLCIDHNHATGKVRGVLCHSCNVALGHFKDDISLLEKAIVYLKGNQ